MPVRRIISSGMLLMTAASVAGAALQYLGFHRPELVLPPVFLTLFCFWADCAFGDAGGAGAGAAPGWFGFGCDSEFADDLWVGVEWFAGGLLCTVGGPSGDCGDADDAGIVWCARRGFTLRCCVGIRWSLRRWMRRRFCTRHGFVGVGTEASAYPRSEALAYLATTTAAGFL